MAQYKLPCSLAITFALLTVNAQGVRQSSRDEFSLRVMVVESSATKDNARLWLAIKNQTTAAYAFCSKSWGYSYKDTDPNGPIVANEETNIHGCGDPEQGDMWLLLPGESRFDSYGLDKRVGQRGEFDVSMELVATRLGARPMTVVRRVAWKGSMAEARALGRKFMAGQSK
jgi:hypothetical protein